MKKPAKPEPTTLSINLAPDVFDVRIRGRYVGRLRWIAAALMSTIVVALIRML